jgi:hypothetical protein
VACLVELSGTNQAAFTGDCTPQNTAGVASLAFLFFRAAIGSGSKRSPSPREKLKPKLILYYEVYLVESCV